MKRAALISVVVGAALAIVPAAFAATASDGGGAIRGGSSTITPMTQIDPAIQAVLVRNHAEHYVLLTGKALADFYDTGAVVTSTPTQDTGAFVGRPDILGGTGMTPAASTGNSFDTNWSAVVPAILLSILLLGTTWMVVTRRRHQLSV